MDAITLLAFATTSDREIYSNLLVTVASLMLELVSANKKPCGGTERKYPSESLFWLVSV